MTAAQQSLRLQRIVTVTSVILFIVKVVAYLLTHSVAILTDALESTVNVVAAFVGWYSLYVSAKPRDMDHPYGHGKVEFLSAGLEGTLIAIAGFIIIYEAIINLIHPHTITQLDWGLILVGATAVINYILGSVCVKTGKKNDSLALMASGKHLQSDAYSTVGIIVGLIVLLFTNINWIDSVVAIVFAFIVIITGYRILRTSIAGIMDEADNQLLERMVVMLNNNRKDNWMDMHNLRIIKYGGVLHLDCHLTVPWYFNVNEAHKEIDDLSTLVKDQYGSSVELFVHSDACMEFSCRICSKKDCNVRQHPFEKRIEWTMENISSNKKHHL